MPSILKATLPWLELDLKRVYVLGSSMGGQETLLPAAKYPTALAGGDVALAGAGAFDAPCDLVTQCGYLTSPAALKAYLAKNPHGNSPPASTATLMLEKIGTAPPNRPGWNEAAVFYDSKYGTHWSIRQPLNKLPVDESNWDERSPVSYVDALANLTFPLRIYWSSNDTTVGNQTDQSAMLYTAIKAKNVNADVVEVSGGWEHSVEFEQGSPDDQITGALQAFGLIS